MEAIKIHEGIELNPEKGEMLVYGVRHVTHAPEQIYREIDLVMGSSADVLVHVVWHREGYREFESALERQRDKSKEEILRDVAESDRYEGWGITSYEIQDQPTLKIFLRVKNPPVKSVQGSAIRSITGFWSGVFSKFCDKRVTPHDLRYDADKDEFTCTMSV